MRKGKNKLSKSELAKMRGPFKGKRGVVEELMMKNMTPTEREEWKIISAKAWDFIAKKFCDIREMVQAEQKSKDKDSLDIL